MAEIKAFSGLRPRTELAADIAALPYDVYSRKEARLAVQTRPLSFLRIDRAETQFPPGTDMYDLKIYQKAHDLLQEMIAAGQFVRESDHCYYLYELTANQHTQTGIVGCTSIDDFENGTIKKHENTRADKEFDRIRHVDICNAQTGPIFLAYRSNEALNRIVARIKSKVPLVSFASEDAVEHTIWKISDSKDTAAIHNAFSMIPNIYIADGHHRAASAVKVGLKRRAEAGTYTGEEEFNYVLSVLFPDDQLQILAYNRVIKGLNGHTPDSLLKKIETDFEVTNRESTAYEPDKKHSFGMYLSGKWYQLKAKPHLLSTDAVAQLDVSILQDYILSPLLGIENPKTDDRIQFVGGIRGLDALVETVDSYTDGVAFSMYPTSMQELFAVADEGRLMPPKSTWFEPKLRSGLFIHEL